MVRTRARTWDPLIKSHATTVVTKREFYKLAQNPCIADQWLAGKISLVEPVIIAVFVTGTALPIEGGSFRDHVCPARPY
jgi:hypothetical protein